MNWNWKKLLFCHFFAAFLLGSLFFPWTHQIWNSLDRAIFKSLNQTLHGHEGWKTFWALANHRHADWVQDVFILGFYSISILRMPKFQRLSRTSQFIFSVLFIALTILLINRLLCRDFLSLRRYSPTLTLEGSIRLSEEISWMDIKDETTKSFPGDHATSALLFALTYAFFAGKRWGTIAIFYAIFLCLPRLIAGAHWFSDIMVGTGSIVLLSFSWAFYTPLYIKGSMFIEKALRKIKPAALSKSP